MGAAAHLTVKANSGFPCGVDPVSDQYTIINEEFGRRVNLIEPEKVCFWQSRNDVAHGV